MKALSARDPLVLGRFRLLGRLGAGGMGRVYLGRGAAGELVAVKMMHTRIADDPGFRGAGPFAGSDDTPLAVARRILGAPPDLRDVPSELAEALTPCFEKLAEHRCSAADLVDRLADLTDVVGAAWPSFYHDLWMREFSS
jgi:hypothetical protein